MPTLVLLGAGASHGSEPDRNIRTPPLGNYLFGELCALGGVASKIPDDIKKVFFDQGFEEGMALFNARINIQLQAFHRELSAYLADFVPTSQNYYLDLLKKLGGRNVVFSSLNYDMMLEEAAIMIGMNVTYGVARAPNTVRVLKPHGSINFWPDSPPEMFTNCSFSNCGPILEIPVRPLRREPARNRCITDTSLSPAISMYAKGKKVSICPSFVREQQERFSAVCKQSSRILIIGVRVIPEDVHIWQPILKSGSEITYFGNDNDESELRAWATKNDRNNYVFVNGYFGKAIEHITPFI